MKRVSRRGARPWLPALLALPYSTLSLALNTAAIVPTVSSPDCMEYQVVGVCYWLRCTNFGCNVKTSAKVRHYVPDAVVSSYSTTGDALPISGAQGGGSGTLNSPHENSLSVFKNVDVIGHPGIAAFNAFASGSGYTCEGAGTPYVPHFPTRRSTLFRSKWGTPYVPHFLSTLDPLGWRHGLPESLFPQALIPGLREVGSRVSMNLWGNVYPRSGFLHQPDDYKASAVMAQRAGDIVTRPGQVHVYRPLLAAAKPGYWPAGELRESDALTGKQCILRDLSRTGPSPAGSGWRLRLVTLAPL